METLENRTHGGADVIAVRGNTFSEAMRNFLSYLRIPLIPEEEGTLFEVATTDGSKSSVISVVNDGEAIRVAQDVIAKLERGFRKASCGMAAQGVDAPKLVVSKVRLHLIENGSLWALCRTPAYDDLEFQTVKGQTVPSEAELMVMIQTTVDKDFCKIERGKAAA